MKLPCETRYTKYINIIIFSCQLIISVILIKLYKLKTLSYCTNFLYNFYCHN